ncbi:MAG: hypothetical protein IKT63_03470 [Oscillospiraceae bacterium]|nr:hypothetical protein [Oscillospiraceae bacterium]
MDKKKIDVQENIIDTENFLPEENSVKITYRAEETETENKAEEEILSRNDIKSNHRRRVIIGAVMCVLMLIGMGTIIASGVGVVVKIFDNTAEKEAYNALLSTLVVADPLPFESPDQADMELLLSSSVWAAVMNEDMSKYETNDIGQTYLPAVDVDRYFAKVFGTQFVLEHDDFSDQGADFEYDEDKQAYIVPVTSLPTGFTPKVEKIKTGKGEKIVTVGYISPATNWNDTSDGSVSKYVDYIFQKQGKDYYLVAIRDESETKVEIAPQDVAEPQ